MELPSGAKVGTQYRVLERIARTSFSESDEKLAIKIESKANKHSKLKHEAEVYRSLTGGIGIPFIRWFEKEGDCNAMVFDILGTPLEELFDFCNRKFSLKTVLVLADQLISRIDPKNLLTGTDKSGNQVHVIEFHSAKEYRDPQSHAHIACCENQRPIGDPTYASISTHLGLEQSRRDDIESLGYVMLYFCRGSLPWQEHNAHKGEQLWNWVKEKMSSTSIEDLCFGLPPEFTDYLHYARSLDFDQEPDYAYLRGLFRAIFSREGFQYDYVFDWTWHEQQ
ncbi:serine/threonine protein kinase, partial [Exophiala xenobiotica]